MGKIINAYNQLTAQQIKNKADIPNQSDMVVNGSTVDCSNITITKVKNVLGEGSTTVGGLCTSNNVNKWSGFSPVEWYISGGQFLNRVKTPYTLGSFAGYNHQAQPVSLADELDFNYTYAPEETTYQLNAAIILGELNLAQMYGITHINWIVKRDGIVVGSSHNTIVYSVNDTFYISCTIVMDDNWGDGISNLTSEMYFANNSTSLCKIPNIPTMSFTAFRLTAPITNTTPEGIITDVEITSGVDINGNYDFTLTTYTDVYQAYYGPIYVNAVVYDENNNYIGTHTMSSGDYDYNRTFSGNVGISIGYGYVIDVVVSY